MSSARPVGKLKTKHARENTATADIPEIGAAQAASLRNKRPF